MHRSQLLEPSARARRELEKLYQMSDEEFSTLEVVVRENLGATDSPISSIASRGAIAPESGNKMQFLDAILAFSLLQSSQSLQSDDIEKTLEEMESDGILKSDEQTVIRERIQRLLRAAHRITEPSAEPSEVNDNPLIKLAGKYRDNPLREELLQAARDYRLELAQAESVE